MKNKSLNKTGDFIMLSGQIDKNYIIRPGTKVIFGAGSTFEGLEIASGTVFRNNEHIAKQFSLNQLGQLQLTSLQGSSDHDHEAREIHSQNAKKSLALIIPSSSHSFASGENSSLELGLPEELSRQRPLAPTAEKDLWNDIAPRDSGSLSTTEITLPTRIESLPSHRNQLAQEDTDDTPTISGENAKEDGCYNCCLLI